jgi:OPT family oligopeptide transporter
MWLSLDMHLSDAMMGEISELLKVFELDSMRESEKSDFVASKLKTYYYIFDQHSAYAEARASISNTDDPSLPAETFRVWFIGLGMVAMFASMNQVPFRYQQVLIEFFALRFPPINIDALVCQVISYPLGVAFARFLPTRKFHVFGYTFSLNPGPFNQKEHILITVMATVGVGTVYAAWIFEIQILKTFFNQPWARNKAYQYCITLSMQCMGYGLAGLARSCLVFPDYCIWPQNLATIILNRSLHEKRSGIQFRFLGISFSRYRYFLVLTGLYFVWHL